MSSSSSLRDYLHPPALTAGFVAVLVGFAGSVAIVFQAATAAGASPAQVGSWIMALGLGMGLTSIGLSLYYKAPVMTAWSTPGAALLVTSLPGIPLSEAVGAFIFSALLITLSGFSGIFERMMNRIPLPIAAAMLAGVLFQFGVGVFTSMESELPLVLVMCIAYLVGKRWWPRYAIVGVLLVGLAACAGLGKLEFSVLSLTFGAPEFVAPSFTLGTLIGVGIPLFVVTMVSQNMPGIAVLRTAGYSVPLSPVIGWTGLATLVLAPFGGFALNLAAITAAICAGPEAHENPQKRYVAVLSAGFFYLLLGIMGFTAAALFAAFPGEFVLALAGLALLATIANSLAGAVADDSCREAAIITFIVTASGLVIAGIGPAFWGLAAGLVAMQVFRK